MKQLVFERLADALAALVENADGYIVPLQTPLGARFVIHYDHRAGDESLGKQE